MSENPWEKWDQFHKAATRTIPIVYWDEIKPNLDAADFVEGLLIEESMSVIYGQSNSGKTFWMADVALHVATGKVWRGREVEQGAVLWLAMEGSHGIYNRIAAWREHHGIADSAMIPFAVIPVALDLLDPEADTDPLIDLIRAAAERMGCPIKLVVVDTLSRAMAGGNENAPDDMGALVANGTRIQQAAKAHVAWIHHAGKDEARGARGHSALRGATDTEIEITADGHMRNASVRKQRDLESGQDFPFTLKIVSLGTNRRGKEVTSCIVEDAEAAASPKRAGLSDIESLALRVLVDLVASAGRSGDPGTPSGAMSVPAQWWRDRFDDNAMPGAGDDAKRKAFERAVVKLQAKSLIGAASKRVWVVYKDENGAESE